MFFSYLNSIFLMFFNRFFSLVLSACFFLCWFYGFSFFMVFCVFVFIIYLISLFFVFSSFLIIVLLYFDVFASRDSLFYNVFGVQSFCCNRHLFLVDGSSFWFSLFDDISYSFSMSFFVSSLSFFSFFGFVLLFLFCFYFFYFDGFLFYFLYTYVFYFVFFYFGFVFYVFFGLFFVLCFFLVSFFVNFFFFLVWLLHMFLFLSVFFYYFVLFLIFAGFFLFYKDSLCLFVSFFYSRVVVLFVSFFDSCFFWCLYSFYISYFLHVHVYINGVLLFCFVLTCFLFLFYFSFVFFSFVYGISFAWFYICFYLFLTLFFSLFLLFVLCSSFVVLLFLLTSFFYSFVCNFYFYFRLFFFSFFDRFFWFFVIFFVLDVFLELCFLFDLSCIFVPMFVLFVLFFYVVISRLFLSFFSSSFVLSDLSSFVYTISFVSRSFSFLNCSFYELFFNVPSSLYIFSFWSRYFYIGCFDSTVFRFGLLLENVESADVNYTSNVFGDVLYIDSVVFMINNVVLLNRFVLCFFLILLCVVGLNLFFLFSSLFSYLIYLFFFFFADYASDIFNQSSGEFGFWFDVGSVYLNDKSKHRYNNPWVSSLSAARLWVDGLSDPRFFNSSRSGSLSDVFSFVGYAGGFFFDISYGYTPSVCSPDASVLSRFFFGDNLFCYPSFSNSFILLVYRGINGLFVLKTSWFFWVVVYMFGLLTMCWVSFLWDDEIMFDWPENSVDMENSNFYIHGVDNNYNQDFSISDVPFELYDHINETNWWDINGGYWWGSFFSFNFNVHDDLYDLYGAAPSDFCFDFEPWYVVFYDYWFCYISRYSFFTFNSLDLFDGFLSGLSFFSNSFLFNSFNCSNLSSDVGFYYSLFSVSSPMFYSLTHNYLDVYISFFEWHNSLGSNSYPISFYSDSLDSNFWVWSGFDCVGGLFFDLYSYFVFFVDGFDAFIFCFNSNISMCWCSFFVLYDVVFKFDFVEIFSFALFLFYLGVDSPFSLCLFFDRFYLSSRSFVFVFDSFACDFWSLSLSLVWSVEYGWTLESWFYGVEVNEFFDRSNFNFKLFGTLDNFYEYVNEHNVSFTDYLDMNEAYFVELNNTVWNNGIFYWDLKTPRSFNSKFLSLPIYVLMVGFLDTWAGLCETYVRSGVGSLFDDFGFSDFGSVSSSSVSESLLINSTSGFSIAPASQVLTSIYENDEIRFSSDFGYNISHFAGSTYNIDVKHVTDYFSQVTALDSVGFTNVSSNGEFFRFNSNFLFGRTVCSFNNRSFNSRYFKKYGFSYKCPVHYTFMFDVSLFFVGFGSIISLFLFDNFFSFIIFFGLNNVSFYLLFDSFRSVCFSFLMWWHNSSYLFVLFNEFVYFSVFDSFVFRRSFFYSYLFLLSFFNFVLFVFICLLVLICFVFFLYNVFIFFFFVISYVCYIFVSLFYSFLLISDFINYFLFSVTNVAWPLVRPILREVFIFDYFFYNICSFFNGVVSFFVWFILFVISIFANSPVVIFSIFVFDYFDLLIKFFVCFFYYFFEYFCFIYFSCVYFWCTFLCYVFLSFISFLLCFIFFFLNCVLFLFFFSFFVFLILLCYFFFFFVS